MASDVAPYKKTKSLLCRTADDWYTHLKRLIGDKEMRDNLLRVARGDVLCNHTWQGEGRQAWLNLFKELAG